MEDDMLEYAALRTKELGEEAPSADNVCEKAPNNDPGVNQVQPADFLLFITHTTGHDRRRP